MQLFKSGNIKIEAYLVNEVVTPLLSNRVLWHLAQTAVHLSPDAQKLR